VAFVGALRALEGRPAELVAECVTLRPALSPLLAITASAAAGYFWLGSRVRDPDRMAVVSGAAFSRACCSVTPLCMVERRLLLVRRRASAASKITITPVASNPTRSATATFFLVLEASSDPHQVSGAV